MIYFKSKKLTFRDNIVDPDWFSQDPDLISTLIAVQEADPML